MTDAPLITVLLPVYNGAPFLPEALASVQAQTCADFELLVIDDGSTDDTPHILAGFAAREPRLRLVRRQRRGRVPALNHGLALARGRFLARLDADDRMHPARLERQLERLQAGPDLALLGSAYRLVDEHGAPGPVHGQPLTDTGIRWQMLFHSAFAHPSVMLPLDILRRHALEYDPQQVTEDYELWSRLLEHGRGANLPEPLVDYRQHARQSSRVEAPQFWEAATAVAQRNIERLGLPLPAETVSVLRGWFYAFPRRLSPAEAAAALALCAVLERFAAQPGLDRGEVRRIRGRWALKLLAGARPLDRDARREIRRRLGPAGWLAAAAYAPGRLLRGRLVSR
jgi:hypothetical protein